MAPGARVVRANRKSLAIMWTSLLLLPVGAILTQQAPLLEDRQTSAVLLQTTVPNGASQVVSHAYPGLAMSSHSFSEYAGNTSHPNTFSANLIQSIASRTGSAVHIRVGGTSGDFSVYEPNQTTALVLPPGSAPGSIPKGIRIGPPWFQGFANFPGVQFTYMAHLANDSAGQQANSVAGVQEALKYIGSNLENLEIGNEIDLYPDVNRPANYSVADYIGEWRSYESAITTAVGQKTYQAPVYAENDCPFCIANTFNLGQNSLGNVKSAALHHYMDSGPVPVSEVQSHYMNHTRIVSQLDPFTTPIAYLRANQPNIPLYLAEVNSNTYSTDNYDVIGIFGSALWLVDFMMYGMAINITRMNIQQSTGFSYASWRGVEYDGLPAAVLPPYYAHPFVADVIGNSSNIRVASLEAGSSDTFSSYGIYDATSGALTKAVLINLQLYNSTIGGARSTRTFNLNVGSSYTMSGHAKAERLTAAGAEVQDASTISWKGLSWSYASVGKAYAVASTTTTIAINNGILAVPVKASEAVLVTF